MLGFRRSLSLEAGKVSGPSSRTASWPPFKSLQTASTDTNRRNTSREEKTLFGGCLLHSFPPCSSDSFASLLLIILCVVACEWKLVQSGWFLAAAASDGRICKLRWMVAWALQLQPICNRLDPKP